MKEKTDEELDTAFERAFRRWCWKADIWYWICTGHRWRISTSHADWANSVFYRGTDARMWAMAIAVAEHEGKI